MFHLLFRFNSIQAIRIQSLPNPFRKCHHQTNLPFSLFQYLQSSLGFSPERALVLSQQLKRYNPKNPDSVPTFFKSHGFSETHIKSIINRAPLLLGYSSPESSLKPKIQFFQEMGISGSDLVNLVVSNTHLFTYSLEGRIKPVFHYLGSFLGTDEFALQFLIQSKSILNPDIMSANLTILRNSGVQNQHILKQFMNHPRTLGTKSDRFNEAVEMVKGMGFKPQKNSFVQAVFTILCLSRQTWDAKYKFYAGLWWSAEDILLLFCKRPCCMRLSEKKIKMGFDYLTKELGWGPSLILMYPILLSFSLEKRIIPRHRILQFLVSKGFTEKDNMSVRSFIKMLFQANL